MHVQVQIMNIYNSFIVCSEKTKQKKNWSPANAKGWIKLITQQKYENNCLSMSINRKFIYLRY